MVKPNNYMFRPLAGHYQVVHSMKHSMYSPQPFSLNVKSDDGLLETETSSC